MTPPCTQCKHCSDYEIVNENVYFYCDFDESWLTEEYAYSDLECDAYEQKLDDNKTKASRA